MENMVMKYFEELSKIPRGSGNEKAVSDYIAEAARSLGYNFYQDEYFNLIIKIPATKGYENSPTVIIQGHLDMVCEKNKGKTHDFEKDPISLKILGDMVYAEDTTLGADNGIALAYGLAIMNSSIAHPALELVFTAQEETSMIGAKNLDLSKLSGTILINLDSEEEGRLLASCAGGATVKLIIPVKMEKAKANQSSYLLSISGLKGGHSGSDIHIGRGNANKMIGRVLNSISEHIQFSIAEINGGMKSNAIPREAEAVVTIDERDIILLTNKINEWQQIFKKEFAICEPDVTVKIEKDDKKVAEVFNEVTKNTIISVLMLVPNGVVTMSKSIEKLVETSTNPGVVKTINNEIVITNAVRSSIKTLKDNVVEQLEILAKYCNCKFLLEAEYPGWEYKEESYIRQIFCEAYRSLYKKEAQVTAIHAGLECGIISEILPQLDIISLGPDMSDVHTPNEHFSISSANRTWDLLVLALSIIN